MLSEKVRISVLMAVYNTEFSLVKRAIDSVLQQDFQNFELIVIDDGSTTDPHNQLFNYTKKFEDTITFIRHANVGQSKSINRGILNSRGDYITILDSDDEYKPHHLTRCLNAIEYYDLIASTTDTIVNSTEDYYIPDKEDLTKLIHVDDCILFATLFGRREVFMEFKFKDVYSADFDFFHSVSKKYRVKKLDLRSYIYYRNNPNSFCSTIKKNQGTQV